MSTKLYVGGLPYSTTNTDLEEIFGELGSVISATVIQDRETGRSKGFGFVEMSTNEEAQNAISELDGKGIGGRNIMVNEARERAPRRVNSRW